MYLISLIIPIYNAGEYLDHTINSVIKQSIGFENIELILVDDASSDNSRKIIENYVDKYDNIIPFYSETSHGSSSFGRNVGLKKSTADFIMFMDHDDLIDENFCKKLYEAIIEEKADIVCCDKVTMDSISEIKNSIPFSNGIRNKDNYIICGEDILLFKSATVWNKIYRKEIINKNNIRFPENIKIGEDYLFNINYYLKSNKLVYLKDYYGYIWNVKSDSITHDVDKENILDILESDKHIFDALKENNKSEIASELFKENITFLLTQCSYLKVNNNEFKNILKEIYDFEKEINFKLNLSEKMFDIINKLLLRKYFLITIYFLKTIAKIRNSMFLRKLYRKIKF